MKRAHKLVTTTETIKMRVPYDTLMNKKFNRMKYLYLILLGMLVFGTATYTEGNDNAGQMSVIQQDNITVIGKIVDENGEPLPGATIQQQGTTNGTITDIDGNFSLSVPSDAILSVSFIGYTQVSMNIVIVSTITIRIVVVF